MDFLHKLYRQIYNPLIIKETKKVVFLLNFSQSKHYRNIYKSFFPKKCMRFNKRGQEISVNTLVLIVIAVLVLVFLIVGFAIGWKKIFPFITPGNNIKDITDKCSLACSTQALYDYCSTKREVRLDEPLVRNSARTSSGIKVNEPIENKKEFTATCKDLESVKELGLGPCATIVCPNYVYSSIFFAERALELSNPECGKIQDASETDAGAYAYYKADGKTKGYVKCSFSSQ